MKIIIFWLLAIFCSCSNTIDTQQEIVDEPEKGDTLVTYQLFPNKEGRLNLLEDQAREYLPGDVLYLRGRFLNVRIVGLKGSAEKPIRITNYPGETLLIGDPSWTSGANSNVIQLLKSQHVIIGSEEDASAFQIEGSTTPTPIGISLQPFTDNIEVKNLSIKSVGVAIMSKTDPVITDPATWYPNTWLENLSIHDISISDITGEAMYIGHSSIYWGWDENGKGYNAGAEPENPAHTFVRPVMWRNVKIYNNNIDNIGWDGIQASSIEKLEIYGNEVSHYGKKEVWGQCMGILVGGNSTYTYVHDNYVHDGHGDAYQFHGANGDNSTHIVSNNLFVNIESCAFGIYGLVDDATVDISNNTAANCKSFALLANGRGKHTVSNLKNNLYVACYLQQPELMMTKYIRIMNNAVVNQFEEKAYFLATDAKVDPFHYYQPLSGSPIGKTGYQLTAAKWNSR